jgi:hypothetical protein
LLALFDATVLCGALVRPAGINFRLLRLAADGVVLDGFTTDVAGYEFVRNALKGRGGVAYHPDTVSAFLDGFAPLFDPENVGRSSIGRDIIDKVWTYDKPVGAVVDELMGARTTSYSRMLSRRRSLLPAGRRLSEPMRLCRGVT